MLAHHKTVLLLAASILLFCVVLVTAGALVGHLAPHVTAAMEPQPPPEPAPATVPQRPSYAQGVRASSEQGAIDWAAVADAGMSFALIRASAGARFEDPAFAANWAGAREAGLVRAAYHVYYPEDDAHSQIEHLANVIGLPGARDLPPIVSLVGNEGSDSAVRASSLQMFLEQLEKRLGRRPVVRVAQPPTGTDLTEALRDHALWLDRPRPATDDAVSMTWSFAAVQRQLQVPGASLSLQRYDGTTAQLDEFAASSVTGEALVVEAPPPGNTPVERTPVVAIPVAPAPTAAPSPPQPARLVPPSGLPADAALGVSVSQYHGLVRWPAVRAAGAAFGYARATAGVGFMDAQFRNNWDGMRVAGVVRGGYHVFYPDDDAVRQADYFVAIVHALRASDLPPAVVVVNEGTGLPADEVAARLRVWLDRVQRKLDRVPVVFATSTEYESLSAGARVEIALWLQQPESDQPPSSSPGWAFWTYATKLHVDGLEGPVDVATFRGALPDLLALGSSSGGTPSPVPATPAAATPAPTAAAAGPAAPSPVPAGDIGTSQGAPTPPALEAASVPSPSSPSAAVETYRVKRGDTLFSIAKRYGVSVDALVAANGIVDVQRMEVGKVLRLP